MQTRSRASSGIIDRASENTKKRKRRDDDFAVGYAAPSTVKRCKTRSCGEAAILSPSMALRAKSPLKRKGPNTAVPEMPAEGLSAPRTCTNGDDEAFAMTLGKFVCAVRKRGAADKSSQKPTGEKCCAFLKKSTTENQSTEESSNLIQPGQSCDHTHILNDGHGRDNENSTEGGAMEQCSSGFGRNTHTLSAAAQYDQDGLEIVDSPLSPQEVTCTQCQLPEDDHHNVADATLVQGKAEKCLHHTKRGSSPGGNLTSLSKRRSEERALSGPGSGKSKGCPGYVGRFKKQREESIDTMLTEVSQQENSCHSRKRLIAAKSRWKNLAQRILSTKNFLEKSVCASEGLLKHQVFLRESAPGNDHSHKPTGVPVGNDQTTSIANSKHNKMLKKQKKPSSAASALSGRMQQKVQKQQRSLLKRMKTWLAEAKFSQGHKEKNSNDVGEEFFMTENDRLAFAQTMIQSCQKNPNMRTVLLESVRMLISSGLMQAAASSLLLQGPCDEAQIVMNAWTEFKEQNEISKTLPMNLLSAINQLHEKRGDLLTKLSTPNVAGICALSQVDEKTWKFQLPEDTFLPRNMGHDTTV